MSVVYVGDNIILPERAEVYTEEIMYGFRAQVTFILKWLQLS